MVENYQYQARRLVSTRTTLFFARRARATRALEADDGGQGVSRPNVQSAARSDRGSGSRTRRVAIACALALLVLAGPAAAVSAAASPAPDVAAPEGSGSFTPAPSPASPAPASTLPPGSGARVYAENCSGCHGPKGEGYVGPPLAAGRVRQPRRTDGRAGRHQHAPVRRRPQRERHRRRRRLRLPGARRPLLPRGRGQPGRRHSTGCTAPDATAPPGEAGRSREATTLPTSPCTRPRRRSQP